MEKEQQAKLLTEIVETNQKNGLYEGYIGDTNKMVTAVEWLVEEIEKHYIINNGGLNPTIVMELKRQAKQMEKMQMNECWNVAHQAGRFEGKGIAEENWQTFKQYYNETYGKDSNESNA